MFQGVESDCFLESWGSDNWEICLERRPSEICVRFRCGCDLLYRHQIANLQFPGFNFQGTFDIIGSNVDPGGVWTVVIPCFLTCARSDTSGLH
ncbi:hypothetical protein L6452_01778 [Arctium lappa]|uniref:Uncharacterized protein n=1 Tax=Arctium lappa TaxID=4217 RepID=A0ACB9FJ41_ARCLA|nr:hypothetical protein L6452_01778 [Arctium lappa]